MGHLRGLRWHDRHTVSRADRRERVLIRAGTLLALYRYGPMASESDAAAGSSRPPVSLDTHLQRDSQPVRGCHIFLLLFFILSMCRRPSQTLSSARRTQKHGFQFSTSTFFIDFIDSPYTCSPHPLRTASVPPLAIPFAHPGIWIQFSARYFCEYVTLKLSFCLQIPDSPTTKTPGSGSAHLYLPVLPMHMSHQLPRRLIPPAQPYSTTRQQVCVCVYMGSCVWTPDDFFG